MQITVTIPDELAAELQSRGMIPQSYLESRSSSKSELDKVHHYRMS